MPKHFKLSFLASLLLISCGMENPYKKQEPGCINCKKNENAAPTTGPRTPSKVSFDISEWTERAQPWTRFSSEEAIGALKLNPFVIFGTLFAKHATLLNELQSGTTSNAAGKCIQENIAAAPVRSGDTTTVEANFGHCLPLRTFNLQLQNDSVYTVKDKDITQSHRYVVQKTVGDFESDNTSKLQSSGELLSVFPFGPLSQMNTSTKPFSYSILTTVINNWAYEAARKGSAEGKDFENFSVFSLGASEKEPFTAHFDPATQTATYNGQADLLLVGLLNSLKGAEPVPFPMVPGKDSRLSFMYYFEDFKITNPTKLVAENPFEFNETSVLSGSYFIFLGNSYGFRVQGDNKPCVVKVFQMISDSEESARGAVNICSKGLNFLP